MRGAKGSSSSLWIAVDGASKGNPGAAGIGVVIHDEAGEVIQEIGEYIGETTNNVAEYSALIRGLEAALDHGAASVRITTDSELLAGQIAGQYKVKSQTLLPLHEQAKALLSRFASAQIRHVPRAENARADRLASDAASNRKTRGRLGRARVPVIGNQESLPGMDD